MIVMVSNMYDSPGLLSTGWRCAHKCDRLVTEAYRPCPLKAKANASLALETKQTHGLEAHTTVPTHGLEAHATASPFPTPRAIRPLPWRVSPPVSPGRPGCR